MLSAGDPVGIPDPLGGALVRSAPGGFPVAFLAKSEAAAKVWLMLAHYHGGIFNGSERPAIIKWCQALFTDTPLKNDKKAIAVMTFCLYCRTVPRNKAWHQGDQKKRP